jgi:NAD(P)H dehydrogenase (quinone)
MNTLVIVAHPNPMSFNKRGILEAVRSALAAKGASMVVRDLYEMHFNPILSTSDFESLQQGKTPKDIKKEQDYIRWAKNIVVIAPTWWIGRPAILQGYYDRVLSNGFAFEYGPNGAKGLLINEKVLVINTAGTSEPVYDSWPGSKELLKRPTTEGIFNFCGIKEVEHLQFYGIPTSTPEERDQMLEKVVLAVRKME